MEAIALSFWSRFTPGYSQHRIPSRRPRPVEIQETVNMGSQDRADSEILAPDIYRIREKAS